MWAKKKGLDDRSTALAQKLMDKGVKVYDSFNRPDNSETLGNADTGQAWIPSTFNYNQYGTVGNKLASISNTAVGNVCIESSISNCKVTVTFAVYQEYSGIMVRRSVNAAENSMLSLRRLGTDMQLSKWDNGIATNIATVSGLTLTDGDLWMVECNGSSIKCYQNGILRLTATETAHATNTRHGIVCSGAINARYDDFTVEVL